MEFSRSLTPTVLKKLLRLKKLELYEILNLDLIDSNSPMRLIIFVTILNAFFIENLIDSNSLDETNF